MFHDKEYADGHFAGDDEDFLVMPQVLIPINEGKKRNDKISNNISKLQLLYKCHTRKLYQ